jgi:hypothetical protein
MNNIDDNRIGDDAPARDPGVLGGVSDRVRSAAGAVKEQASSMFDTSSESVRKGWSTVRQGASANPVAAVAGAAVIGAGIGWLLPSGRREQELLSEVAHKVTDAAREAANTAVEAGRQQVDDLTQNALASVGGAVVGAVMSGERSRPE